MKKHYFWKQRNNLPDDIGYNQFSIKHLMMLIGVILFTVLMTYAYIHLNMEARVLLRRTIAIVLILSEIMKLLVIHFNHGDVLNYIPIEICSIGAYCIVIDAFSAEPTFVRVMLLVLFLPAAIMALIYPTTVEYPVWNFFTLHQFLFHGLIVAYVIALFVSKEIMIGYGDVWKSIFTIIGIASIVYLIDRIFHRNFMFLTYDEENKMLHRLTILSGGGIKYTLTLVLFCILMIHVFYFIFKLIEMLL